jgi:type II secretory ATPase GspE/PulE/Tfp pilus assembly ATPase PilB-like protein
MLLLDLFVSQNKLTELEAKDIEDDMSLHAELVVDTLLEEKSITSQEVADMRSVLHGLPVYSGEIGDTKELTKYISTAQSKQLLAVPLELKDGVVLVGVVDPERANVLDSLQFLFGTDHQAYKVYLITYDAYKKHFGIRSDISSIKKNHPSATARIPGQPAGSGITPSQNSKLNQAQSTKNQASKPVKPDEKDEQSQNVIIDLSDVDGNVEGDLSDVAIPDIFNMVLRHAIDVGASDIHIEDMGSNVRARLRLDGQLETVMTLPASMHPMLIARIKILCSMKLDEKRKPQDGRFSTKFQDHSIDYRVSTFPGYYGEKMVIRVLDSYKGVRSLDTLGFSEHQMKDIRTALSKPFGMILISGPTGSGKTTTLYAMLNEIDREHRNVVSLEDPIEYNVPSMTQSQVFPEIGYTFASGLRSILRQDPDVIMVGEIRDAETAQLAIQAALTGHLVFSTIHTNTAIGVVTRLLDMGIEPYLIAPTLIAAVGQRLSRGIAKGCGVPMEMNVALEEIKQLAFKDLPDEFKSKLPLDKPFFEAKPNATSASGMKGRVPVFEILMLTDRIQEAVLHKKGEDTIWQLARAHGMITMKEDAMLKCISGIIPYVEVNEL